MAAVHPAGNCFSYTPIFRDRLSIATPPKSKLKTLEDQLGFRIIITAQHNSLIKTFIHAFHGQSNVENAFKVMNPQLFKGRWLLLIDDVCTTTATLNECARVLKNAGAEKVYSCVAAITPG